MPQQVEIRNWSTECQRLTEGDSGLGKLWETFDDLSQRPRSSGKEKAVLDYVRKFIEKRDLVHEIDEASNILIILPATQGLEHISGLIFQGHLDMVCVGEPSPAENGVKLLTFNDENLQKWITADQTSLGADNGIGISAMLALADEALPHGPLALLLTNREEVGLVSAREMSLKNKLEGFKFLINTDSENEGEATISSAGAADTTIVYSIKTEPIAGKTLLDLSLNGLMGGHSGTVIGERRINAIRALADTLLWIRRSLGEEATVNLVSIDGGTARNPIPKSVRATIAADRVSVEQIRKLLLMAKEELLKESLHEEERSLEVQVIPSASSAPVALDSNSTFGILEMIHVLPNGLIRMSDEVAGLPETSSNIGIVDTKGNEIAIKIMTRSSINKQLEATRRRIREIALSFSARVDQPPMYSGWPPIVGSEINRLVSEAWLKTGGTTLKLHSTHGGLECGVLLGRFPHLQAVSIGPSIRGAHTTEEKVNVESVNRFYRFLKAIVENVARLA